jgi:hypothetical protein
MEWLVPIAVAFITGPVVVLLQRLRKENSYQHAESRNLLEHVVIKVDNLDDKFDKHIGDNHGH